MNNLTVRRHIHTDAHTHTHGLGCFFWSFCFLCFFFLLLFFSHFCLLAFSFFFLSHSNTPLCPSFSGCLYSFSPPLPLSHQPHRRSRCQAMITHPTSAVKTLVAGVFAVASRGGRLLRVLEVCCCLFIECHCGPAC